MEIIRQSAWKLLLEYGSARPLQLKDLFQICKDHEWDIYPYSQAGNFIKVFPDLVEKVKTCSAVSHISDDLTVVLYQDGLSSVDKRTAISHEIGHIWLQHVGCGNKGMSRYTDTQEREADVFACELLLPTVVTQYCGIRTPSQLKKLGLLSEDGTHYEISEIQDHLEESPNLLESQVLQRFSGFIREYKIKFGKQDYQKHIQKRFAAVPLLLLVVLVAYLYYQRIMVPISAMPNSTPEITAPAEYDQKVVHITRVGGKYHKAGCQYVSADAMSVTQQEAVDAGLEPCKVCWPKPE